MFPGRTYFALFIERQRGRCAHGSAEKIYDATNEKCGVTGKYRNVRGMFPGRTYFALFIETERGRCATAPPKYIYGAMTAGLVTPEAPGLVTP